MTQLNDMADLQALVAAIAASPIVVPASKAANTATNARDFADWCALQGDVEIDTVILKWLRSHRPQPATFS
jgi:hypothetical protein